MKTMKVIGEKMAAVVVIGVGFVIMNEGIKWFREQ